MRCEIEARKLGTGDEWVGTGGEWVPIMALSGPGAMREAMDIHTELSGVLAFAFRVVKIEEITREERKVVTDG